MTNHLPTERRRLVRARAEHGAALVLVAILIFVLLGGTAFVLDYGVMWVSRRQAQNAADAGALAGAVARAFDDTATAPAEGGRAWTSAMTAARANNVWNEPPAFEIPEGGWACPDFVTPAGRCVTVNVYRDSEHANALPIYFGALFGRTSQKVRATATANAIPANATNCLRPWGVPDRWIENTAPPFTPDSTFDLFDEKGNPLPNPDVYVPATKDSPGSGYTTADQNLLITLHLPKGGDENDQTGDPTTGGWYRSLDLVGDSGASTYERTIESCVGSPTRIGQYVLLEPGRMRGANRDGIENLINQDPEATWVYDSETGRGRIVGGCMAARTCTLSPRVVAIALYDPYDYATRIAAHNKAPCPGGARQCVKVVNLMGFFVAEGVAKSGDVKGYIYSTSGYFDDTGGQWVVTNPDYSFLWDIRLVR